MTDDLVARLRHEQELCAVMGDTKAGTLVGEAADRLEAAEARVRELEAQLADQRAMSKYNREQAEKAERALAEAYERAAKTCEQVQKGFLSPEYATPQPTGSIGERFACGICAEEIRKLAQEERHAKSE